MNTRILLLAVVVVSGLASCSTAYRTGQTPDDVYFSPDRGQNEYVVAANENRQGGERYNDRYSNRYDDYYNPDDNYLRFMVRNRTRWSAFDDYYWMDARMNPYFGFHNPWSFGGGYYSPWSSNIFYNNYWSWNSFYNPYGYNYVIINPKNNPNAYSRLRSFNSRSYSNPNYANSNSLRRPNYYNSNIRYNSNNNNRSSNNPQLGSSIKKVFSGSDRQNRYYSNGNDERPVRTYSPSSNNSTQRSSAPVNSSSNSGSRSNSSSGGGGSRPTRGN